MLKIEKTALPSPQQWEIIIEGMRNPMNSWDKSDSYKTHVCDTETMQEADFEFFVGEADHKLMMSLAKGGAVHAKYRRMIPVFLTINAPLYWWKEFDTYKVGTVGNSCSTMHKIHAKEFTMEDFSVEHLVGENVIGDHIDDNPFDVMTMVINCLNYTRDAYLEYLKLPTKDTEAHKKHAKKLWYNLIQLLPSSYNQKRTVMLNYEVLTNIYHSRKSHKLDEWHTFCDWIRELPYSELITGEEKE